MTAAKPREYTVRQKRGQNYHIISGLGGGGTCPPTPLPHGSAPADTSDHYFASWCSGER